MGAQGSEAGAKILSMASVPDDAPAVPDDAIEDLWALFRSGTSQTRAWRAKQLQGIVTMLNAHEADFLSALKIDLGKCAFEAASLEVVVTRCEAQSMIGQLSSLMRDERVPTPSLMLPGTSLIRREPLGVCLIIAPFNYPLQLALAPLLGALAAGNCAVLKPSERCAATSALLARYLPSYCAGVLVVEGGSHVSLELTRRRWGLVFFTGSLRVGQAVAQATARTLTPTVLELGGKSPVIVDGTADLDVTARRLAWGKTVNCGQTCIAPDYVVVERAAAQPLLDALARALSAMYGADPRTSADYGLMVDRAAVARMRQLLAVEDHGGRLVLGGECDEERRFVAPSVVLEPRLSSRLMVEEIFGPILPVVVVESAEAAIALVEQRCAQHEPLSLYVFSEDRAFVGRALSAIPSGSALVNDVLLHFGNPNLPFGGIGPSGQGKYHGAASFRCFSHERSVLLRSTKPHLEIERLPRYPPYTWCHAAVVRFLLERLPAMPARPFFKLATLVVLRLLWAFLHARYELVLRDRVPGGTGSS